MKKLIVFCLMALLTIGLAACGSSSTSGSSFPNKSVEFVAAGSPGGGLDTLARSIDQAIHKSGLMKQSFKIKNMGGGGGNPARDYIHGHKGDPYYLLAESDRVYLNKIIGTTKLGIDDFTPIARMTTDYLVWAVPTDSPFKSAKDVLNKMKKDPSSVTFGVGTIPSDDQMNILRPAIKYGIDPTKVKIVAFKSGGDLMTQLLGGHVPIISTGASEAIEQKKAGKVRILAISADHPLKGDFKGIPTWKQLGIDTSTLHWRGLFAPPGTPQDVIDYWNQTLGKMVKTKEWKSVLDKYDLYDAYIGSDKFKKFLKQQSKQTNDLLTKLGLAK